MEDNTNIDVNSLPGSLQDVLSTYSRKLMRGIGYVHVWENLTTLEVVIQNYYLTVGAYMVRIPEVADSKVSVYNRGELAWTREGGDKHNKYDAKSRNPLLIKEYGEICSEKLRKAEEAVSECQTEIRKNSSEGNHEKVSRVVEIFTWPTI